MKKLALMVLTVPVSAALLAGCAHDPTVAARVGDANIPVSDVTVFANFLCANASGNGQVVPMALVNQTAISYLAGAKAVEALAQENHITINTPSGDSADLVSKMPASQRGRGQQLVDEVDGALRATGASSQQQAVATLFEAIQVEARKGKFTSNPNFPIINARGGLISGSLSKAISTPAAASISDSPVSAYVAGLPASQKCG